MLLFLLVLKLQAFRLSKIALTKMGLTSSFVQKRKSVFESMRSVQLCKRDFNVVRHKREWLPLLGHANGNLRELTVVVMCGRTIPYVLQPI